MAGLAHSDGKLETHDGNGQSRHRAAVAHGLAAVPAVVLAQPELSLVHHGPEVPEKRPAAQLTDVRLPPFGRLLTVLLHVPENQHAILPSAD